jgi:quercetin dioxygenase-like cupin family protein
MTTPGSVASTGPTAFIIHPDEGERIAAFGSEAIFKLTGANTAGTMTLLLGVVPPGGGPPPHVHRHDDEFFIIIEGQYRFLIGETWTEVGPGAVVFLPRNNVHTFRNIGKTNSRHWAFVAPSGFETFYARCAEVFAVPGPPDLRRLTAISEDYGYEFVIGQQASPVPAS